MAKSETSQPGIHQELLHRQLVTLGDLHNFQRELLLHIKTMLDTRPGGLAKRWLKSYEVEELLGISANTLLTWRNNGIIPYTPLGGVYYYDPEDLEKVLQDKKIPAIKDGRKK